MRLYNFPNRSVVELDLDSSRAVKIYTCGPTVYDYPHIGNWYTFIRYDLLVRTLQAQGFEINWVMNITDVGHLVSDADDGEDKLEKGAKREGKTAWDVADYYGNYFIEGLERLNFSKVDHLPKATDYINEQIELVKILEEKGYTYVIDDGVYFDVSKFPNYAKFAGLTDSCEEISRIEVNSQKKSPNDFALWKLSPKNERRDMEWESPWGMGFPGWHLECSAMIHAILGEPIDIHAGGTDHIPVHHTNEIAQTTCAYDQPLSKYWMHCNHILVDSKKMSKSLGNFYTLEDIENKGYSLDIFRMLVLSGHYRSQSEFSWETMESSRQRLQSWVDAIALVRSEDAKSDITVTEFKDKLQAILSDDLNSALAISYIDESLARIAKSFLTETLQSIKEITGLDLARYEVVLSEEELEIVNKRSVARQESNWQESDALRDELLSRGIIIRDMPGKTVYSRVV
jgi:cysteinyl-tRNA synthetase